MAKQMFRRTSWFAAPERRAETIHREFHRGASLVVSECGEDLCQRLDSLSAKSV